MDKGIFTTSINKIKNYCHKIILPTTYNFPLTIQNFQKLYARYQFSQFLTYRYADEKGIWLADNPSGMDSYLCGFELSPLIVAGERATRQLEALLSWLPKGTIIHSIAHASADVHNFLELWAMGRRASSNAIYDVITRRRIQHLASWASSDRQVIPGEHFKPRMIRYYWFVKIPSHHTNNNLENYHSHCHEIENVVNKTVSSIKAAGFGIRRLNGSEMITSIRLLANLHCDPVNVREEISNLSMPVAAQILSADTSIRIEKSGDFYFETHNPPAGKYLRVLTATEYPDSPFYLSEMANCIGSMQRAISYIPEQFYVYTIMEVLDNENVKQKALAKMAVLQHQTASSSKWYRSVMRHLYAREKNVEALYEALSKRGEKAIKVWSGLVIAANSLAALDEAVNIAKAEWDHAHLKLVQETAIAVPMWITSLPGQFVSNRDGDVYGLQRGTTMTSLNAATLTHAQGDWQGSRPDQGGLLLMSRRGVLTTMNVFESLTNFNGVMAAASGSGKSFTTNEMITDFLARGGQVRVIDAGRSYFNTAEITSGQNLVFMRGQRICINPFSAIKTQSDLHEDMETLVTLVAQMAFPFGFGQVDMKDVAKTFEYRAIEEGISDVWQNYGSSMSVVELLHWFSKQNDERLQDVARQLKPWAIGRYAEWMVGEANVKFDNPLIVLELDDLAQEPELQGIVLNLILAKIQREMYLSTTQELQKYGYKLPKLLIIDEAWNLLAKPNTGFFIESAYRRARKYQGSIWIITQSFWDCDKTAAARVALDNSNWIMALMQDSGPLKQAVDKGLLSLSEYALHLMNSLQKTDDYSELYLINKSIRGEGLYRLAVDPMTYWTYTTKGEERAKLEELLRAGFSIEEAIEKLAMGL